MVEMNVYESVTPTFADESWKAFVDSNKNFLTNLFFGQLCTNFVCTECGYVSAVLFRIHFLESYQIRAF